MFNQFSLFSFYSTLWKDHLVFVACFVAVTAIVGFVVINRFLHEKSDQFVFPIFLITALVSQVVVFSVAHLNNWYGDKAIYAFVDNPFVSPPVLSFQFLGLGLILVNGIAFAYSFITSCRRNKFLPAASIAALTILAALLMTYVVYIIIPIIFGFAILRLLCRSGGAIHEQRAPQYNVSTTSRPEELVSAGLAGDLYQARQILETRYGH